MLKKPHLFSHKSKKSLNAGDFSVFWPIEKLIKPQKAGKVPLNQKEKAKKTGIISLFVLAFVAHIYAFFEQHFVKLIATPTVVLVSGAILDTLYASEKTPSNPDTLASSDKKDKETQTKQEPESSNKKEKVIDKNPSNKTDLEIDPLSLDETRVKILLSLSKREEELKNWEQSISSRENTLKALEKQVEQKSKELNELKSTIETLVKTNNKEARESLKKVASLYETMKPSDAAKFMNDLPQSTLIELIKAMNNKKFAAIFPLMDPNKIKALTNLMATVPMVPEKSK